MERIQTRKPARPDVDPANRETRVYAITDENYDTARDFHKRKGSLHRLAFVTAAHVSGGLFMDVRPGSAPVPLATRETLQAICVIVDDTAGQGPSAFDRPTLGVLVRDMWSVWIDPTAYFNSAVYLTACTPTATETRHCMLVETTPAALAEWESFVRQRCDKVTVVPMSVQDEGSTIVQHAPELLQ